MIALVKFCIGELARIRVRRRKARVARTQETRHAVRKINRAISKKIIIEDGKTRNIPAVRKRLKTVSQRRRADNIIYVNSICYFSITNTSTASPFSIPQLFIPLK